MQRYVFLPISARKPHCLPEESRCGVLRVPEVLGCRSAHEDFAAADDV